MKTTLLVMAAGIGSRFGAGIKQLVKVDNAKHIIMDYSIHDAIAAGFNKIIFIIRKDIEDEFKEIIGDRLTALCSSFNVEVEYAYQVLSDIPGKLPINRIKPWGTGQAVLSAKNMITSPFAVINADDYYGKEAYVQMHNWLVQEHEANAYAMAGFILKNTLCDNGGVTRGICKVAEGHTHLSNVVETKNIVRIGSGVEAGGMKLDPESFVSMNFWGFPGNPPAFLDALTSKFNLFFEEEVPKNPENAEYLLPTIIGGMLQDNACTVKVLPTNDTWYGITYKEDVSTVQEAFSKMLRDGYYRENLYSDL